MHGAQHRLEVAPALLVPVWLTARRRIWSNGTSLHVRGLRTRTVPWSEVVDVVYRHTGLANSFVRVRRRDGRVVKLGSGSGAGARCGPGGTPRAPSTESGARPVTGSFYVEECWPQRTLA